MGSVAFHETLETLPFEQTREIRELVLKTSRHHPDPNRPGTHGMAPGIRTFNWAEFPIFFGCQVDATGPVDPRNQKKKRLGSFVRISIIPEV